MSRAIKLLFVNWGTLALVLTVFGAGHAQSPAEGTVRNFNYRVWYATQWQVVRFPTVQEAVQYRDKVMGSRGAEVYEAKLADYSSAPDGSIRPGSGPNTEVYVRQWLNDGFESDPHNAFTKLIALKRHATNPETRVQLDYDVRSDDTPMGWVTQSVTKLPELAGELRQTETAETTVKGNLVLNASGELRGEWEDGSGGWLRLEYWDQNQVVFTRRDNGGTNDGLTARYVGRFVGTSLMGEVTWDWQGRTWSGTWNASPGGSKTAQPVAQGCTRAEGVLLEKGSAINVSSNSLSYTNPQSQVTNTIQWEPPPQTISLNQEITLVSWSTHNNQDDGIEVQWETKGLWGYGASSVVAEEQSKETKLRYSGGPISLVGGVRHGGAAGKFRIKWDYNCR